MLFYSVKDRKKVEIKDSEVKMEKDKRGRKRATAMYNGTKLYRYVS
jgi:hypothetical protein